MYFSQILLNNISISRLLLGNHYFAMSNIVALSAATDDQLNVRCNHFTEQPYKAPGSPTSSKGSNVTGSTYRSSDHVDKAHDSPTSSKGSSVTGSTYRSNYHANNEKASEMNPKPEDASTPRIIMVMPLSLTTRQKELKELEEKHKNINKKLNSRSQTAKDEAQKTKLVLTHFKLLKKTKSTRSKKEVTADMVRYLETIDGNDCQATIKLGQKAQRRAISLLHSTLSSPQHGAKVGFV